MNKYYAQGDVRIIPVDKLPEGLKPVKRVAGRVILAEGEVTGHQHAIATDGVELYELNGAMLIHVPDTGATVSHEEHGAIDIPGGYYEARVDCEYRPDAIQKVRD